MGISSTISIGSKHIPIHTGIVPSMKFHKPTQSDLRLNKPFYTTQSRTHPYTPNNTVATEEKNVAIKNNSRALWLTKHSAGMTLSVTAYVAMLIGSIIHSTASTQLINYGLAESGYAPTAINLVEETEQEYNSFLSNSPEFQSIVTSITEAGITTADLIKGEDNLKLSTNQEIDQLIFMLEDSLNGNISIEQGEKIQTGIASLKELRLLHYVVFGENQLSASIVSQNNEPNCQGMSALRAMLLNTNNSQHLKTAIKVINFNPDTPDNLINFEVTLNGKKIPLSYQEIVNAMSKKHILTSQSKDHSLFTTIYSLALNKGFADVTPNMVPSTSPILLTGQGYDTVLTYTLSNAELDSLFKEAPAKVILVAGTFTLEDIKNGITYRQKAHEEVEELSQSKASEFVSLQTERTKDSASTQAPATTNIGANTFVSLQTTGTSSTLAQAATKIPQINFPPASGETEETNTAIMTADKTRQGHIYAVENYDAINKEVLISDAHGAKIKLTLEEAREHLIAVIAPSDSITPLGDQTPIALLFIAMMAAMFAGEVRTGYGVGGATAGSVKLIKKKIA